MSAPSEESLKKAREILGDDTLVATAARGGMINNVWFLANGNRIFGVLKRYTDLTGSGTTVSTGARRAKIEVAALSDRLWSRLPEGPPISQNNDATIFGSRSSNGESAHTWKVILPRSLGTTDDRTEEGGAELFTYVPHEGSLEEALLSPDGFRSEDWREIGTAIGSFFAFLHCSTADEPSLANRFDNGAVQRVRRDVQYNQAYEMLLQYAQSHNLQRPGDPLSGLPRNAGAHFINTAHCLTMGDAWPRSFLLNGNGRQVGVIDWEFAHYGSPAQDMAHLLTHLWMIHNVDPRSSEARHCAEAIVEAYDERLAAKLSVKWAAEAPFLPIHGACEIAMRLAGPFSSGFFLSEMPATVGTAAYEKARQLLSAGHSIRKGLSNQSRYSITPFFRMIFA